MSSNLKSAHETLEVTSLIMNSIQIYRYLMFGAPLFQQIKINHLLLQDDNPKLLVSLIEDSFAVGSILQKICSSEILIGNCKGSIKVIQKKGINEGLYLIKSKEHEDFITQLVTTKVEQLLITSCVDGKIKFWNSSQPIICKQTIDSNLGGVLGISLNQSETQLITFGKQQNILVIKNPILINHEVESYGYRLCFISDNAQENLLYSKINEIKVKKCYIDCLFPWQFIKNKSLLVNKKGNLIYIFLFKDLTEIEQIQVIDFNTYNIYGSVSDDGEFLLTWDDKTNQFPLENQNKFEFKI